MGCGGNAFTDPPAAGGAAVVGDPEPEPPATGGSPHSLPSQPFQPAPDDAAGASPDEPDEPGSPDQPPYPSPCGQNYCDLATQYCQQTSYQTFQCYPLPKACTAAATCNCIVEYDDRAGCYCQESTAGPVVSCVILP